MLRLVANSDASLKGPTDFVGSAMLCAPVVGR